MKLLTAKKLTALLCAVMMLAGLVVPVAAGSDDGFNDVELSWPCEGHQYDDSCDVDCNNCLAKREVEHTYTDDNDICCNVCETYRIVITSAPKTTYGQMSTKVSAKVSAKGDGLKYAWYYKNEGSSKYSKSSVTSATYSTTMSDKAKNRLVYCVITDKHGNEVKIDTFRLRESVSITKEPATVAYAQMGKKVSVKVTASGDSLKYAWYIKNAGSSKFSKSSVTSATYSATMSDKVKGRLIYCVITDNYGKETKSKTFTLREGVSITKESATSVYAENGNKASVKVTASGDGLKYTWYIKNAGASKYSKSSVTSATYSATMSSKVKDRKVYCIVTDKYGNKVQSKTFNLRESVSITKVPATTAYAQTGKKVSVKVTASGDGLKYAWYIKNAGSSKYSKSSVTSATYSATMSSSVKNRQVYCIVTDKYGNKVQTKTFTLRQAVSITTQPKTVTVKKNATAKVTVKASGDGLKYTWYIKNAGASKYTKSSVKTASYSAKMTSSVKNRQVYCVVTDKYGKTVQTVTVKLKMK